MNKVSKLFRPRNKDFDGTRHDSLKRNVIRRISDQLLNNQFKVIDSYISDNYKREELFGFTVLSENEEYAQLRTKDGLYIKISTKEM